MMESLGYEAAAFRSIQVVIPFRPFLVRRLHPRYEVHQRTWVVNEADKDGEVELNAMLPSILDKAFKGEL